MGYTNGISPRTFGNGDRYRLGFICAFPILVSLAIKHIIGGFFRLIPYLCYVPEIDGLVIGDGYHQPLGIGCGADKTSCSYEERLVILSQGTTGKFGVLGLKRLGYF